MPKIKVLLPNSDHQFLAEIDWNFTQIISTYITLLNNVQGFIRFMTNYLGAGAKEIAVGAAEVRGNFVKQLLGLNFKTRGTPTDFTCFIYLTK